MFASHSRELWSSWRTDVALWWVTKYLQHTPSLVVLSFYIWVAWMTFINRHLSRQLHVCVHYTLSFCTGPGDPCEQMEAGLKARCVCAPAVCHLPVLLHLDWVQHFYLCQSAHVSGGLKCLVSESLPDWTYHPQSLSDLQPFFFFQHFILAENHHDPHHVFTVLKDIIFFCICPWS